MRLKHPIRKRYQQRGVGLIEVLVALVVVSFGVLGMASLQLTGMKQSSGGFNRSKASLYAQNMATRIRINTEAVTAGAYNALDSDNAGNVDCSAPPVPYCQARPGGGAVPSCTAAEMATFDFHAVACGDLGTDGADKGVLGTLPNGRLQVFCADPACPPNPAFEVSVTWTEGRSRTDSDEMITKSVKVRLRP